MFVEFVPMLQNRMRHWAKFYLLTVTRRAREIGRVMLYLLIYALGKL